MADDVGVTKYQRLLLSADLAGLPARRKIRWGPGEKSTFRGPKHPRPGPVGAIRRPLGLQLEAPDIFAMWTEEEKMK